MAYSAMVNEFHPAVATWFERRFPDGPSAPQRDGWPHIRQGSDTLIAAPTGSGKTLTGFLVAIDSLYRSHAKGEHLGESTRVVYVSPLKALAVDVHENLERPLAEIALVARELGLDAPVITVGVRTGDTPASARTAMVAHPPNLLVTTPESLYLLVTSERSRRSLAGVDTVIIDEIHALARDKRGSHLALTLERLDHLQPGRPPQRIGLSATQRPIERIAELLTGVGRHRPPAVIDCGHGRALHVSLALPGTELDAVASTEQFGEVVDHIAAQVVEHRTTLVFVNTRRMSERLAHLLAERLGADHVAAHHGSLSKERRLRVEEQLRSGDLRALVATASLELGIDIGPVELVCQVGSPRSIATFLQRVGRSNHSLTGVPEAVLYPLSRDELVECAALLLSVRSGELDSVVVPVAPLDILAQQLVAEVAAAEEWAEDDLYRLVRRASPYAGLDRRDFDAVVELLSEGIPTGRGRRMAYLHRDQVNGVLRPRRGARLASLTSGGAIADVGDYRVVLDPDNISVGTVNEDFAVESMVGDVFLLGTHSWRVRRVEAGVVRVSDAAGMHPTIPFWIGEAPSRTRELSASVSRLRRRIDEILGGAPETGAGAGSRPQCETTQAAARRHVAEACGIDDGAARQLVAYLAAGRQGLGVVPNQGDIVLERFFDEAGGMQMVVHAPFGGRINKALGLALRKRFCATFDFELQAAANDDAVVLSLGPQHSFSLESVPGFLRSDSVATVLSQAVLASPMFTARWRWNLNRSLAVLRFRGGRKNPLPIQRMESDDLMAAVFPALAACQENLAAGPVSIPDHVLVRQTLDDCLHEAMDVDGLVDTVRDIERGAIRLHFVESSEPSVLAHEIINGKPFTFLDDAPLEERRSRAVQMRRGLPPSGEALGRLDVEAIARVRDEATPELRSTEELHDLLLGLVVTRPMERYWPWFDQLVDDGRATTVAPAGARGTDAALWCAVERRPWVDAAFPGASCQPGDPVPVALMAGPPVDADVAVAEVVRGHLEVTGPVTEEELARATALPLGRTRVGLARLESEGFALRGRFDPGMGDEEQWCARRLLARIHSYTQSRLRREIEPVTAQDFMRFLLRWHHVAPGSQRQGRAGVLSVVDQLQGFELPGGAWEEAVLRARVDEYQGRWLEDLCLSGEVAWGRLSIRSSDHEESRRGTSTPSRATPLTFALREDLPWLLRAVRGDVVPGLPAHGASRDLLDVLSARGALFRSELSTLSGRMPGEVEEGVWNLVTRGLVTADGFQAVRSLWSAREVWRRRHHHDARSRLGSRRASGWRQGGEGRWSLLPQAEGPGDPDALAEMVAGQLLARWGVVFWDLTARETMSVPWREVHWALRRLEARGLVRGGRFVTGFTGEQYALPEAVEELRQTRRRERTGEVVRIAAADPLNLVGIVLPGGRVPAVRNRWVVYRDGILLPDDPASPVRGVERVVSP